MLGLLLPSILLLLIAATTTTTAAFVIPSSGSSHHPFYYRSKTSSSSSWGGRSKNNQQQQQQRWPSRLLPTTSTSTTSSSTALNGIKGFRSWFELQFPDAIKAIRTPLLPKKQQQQQPQQQQQESSTRYENFDHVLLDLNPLIHNAMRYSSNDDHTLLILMRELDRLIRNVARPRRSLVIAMDGTPSAAKVATQRARRRSVLSKSSWKAIQLDRYYKGRISSRQMKRLQKKYSNLSEILKLTPGTTFMERVELLIWYWTYQRLQNPRNFLSKPCDYDDDGGVKVYFSSSNVPDEGEVKLLDWIHMIMEQDDDDNSKSQQRRRRRLDPNDSIALVGGDSDLVLESWVLPPRAPRNVFVLLPSGSDKETFLVISSWKVYLAMSQVWLQGLLPAKDMMKVRTDMLLLLILNGNDYLPKLRGSSGFHRIFTFYLKLLKERLMKIQRQLLQTTDDDDDDSSSSSLLQQQQEDDDDYLFLLNPDTLEFHSNFSIAFFESLSVIGGSSTMDSLSQEEYEKLIQEDYESLTLLDELGSLSAAGLLIPKHFEFQCFKRPTTRTTTVHVQQQQEQEDDDEEDDEIITPMDDDDEDEEDDFEAFGVYNEDEDDEIMDEDDDVDDDDDDDGSSSSINQQEEEVIDFDGHVGQMLVRLQLGRPNDDKKKKDSIYRQYEIWHPQKEKLKFAKEKLARMALEDILGKDYVEDATMRRKGGESSTTAKYDWEIPTLLVQSNVELYLSGLLWNIQTYQEGKCADFGYDYGRRMAPTAQEIANYLKTTMTDNNNKSSTTMQQQPPLVNYTGPVSAEISCLAAIPSEAKDLLPMPYAMLPSETLDELYGTCIDKTDNRFDAKLFERLCNEAVLTAQQQQQQQYNLEEEGIIMEEEDDDSFTGDGYNNYKDDNRRRRNDDYNYESYRRRINNNKNNNKHHDSSIWVSDPTCWKTFQRMKYPIGGRRRRNVWNDDDRRRYRQEEDYSWLNNDDDDDDDDGAPPNPSPSRLDELHPNRYIKVTNEKCQSHRPYQRRQQQQQQSSSSSFVSNNNNKSNKKMVVEGQFSDMTELLKHPLIVGLTKKKKKKKSGGATSYEEELLRLEDVPFRLAYSSAQEEEEAQQMSSVVARKMMTLSKSSSSSSAVMNNEDEEEQEQDKISSSTTMPFSRTTNNNNNNKSLQERVVVASVSPVDLQELFPSSPAIYSFPNLEEYISDCINISGQSAVDILQLLRATQKILVEWNNVCPSTSDFATTRKNMKQTFESMQVKATTTSTSTTTNEAKNQRQVVVEFAIDRDIRFRTKSKTKRALAGQVMDTILPDWRTMKYAEIRTALSPSSSSSSETSLQQEGTKTRDSKSEKDLVTSRNKNDNSDDTITDDVPVSGSSSSSMASTTIDTKKMTTSNGIVAGGSSPKKQQQGQEENGTSSPSPAEPAIMTQATINNSASKGSADQTPLEVLNELAQSGVVRGVEWRRTKQQQQQQSSSTTTSSANDPQQQKGVPREVVSLQLQAMTGPGNNYTTWAHESIVEEGVKVQTIKHQLASQALDELVGKGKWEGRTSKWIAKDVLKNKEVQQTSSSFQQQSKKGKSKLDK